MYAGPWRWLTSAVSQAKPGGKCVQRGFFPSYAQYLSSHPPTHTPHNTTTALAAQSAPADLAGKTITEYELLEPAIEEAATDGALTAALGQAEAKEVVAEAQGLEREVAALEIKMDESVGADTAALDKAAAPLAARVDQLSRLIALAGRGVNSN